MANYYCCIDLPAKEAEIPKHFESIDDISHLYSADRVSCDTFSRKNALSCLLAEVAQRYDKQNLCYLSDTVAILNQVQIQTAIAEIESLFAEIKHNPLQIMQDFADYHDASEQDILAVAELPEQTPIPEHLRDDDGEGLIYLLAYLKALLAVLKSALTNDYYVLHGQSKF